LFIVVVVVLVVVAVVVVVVVVVVIVAIVAINVMKPRLVFSKGNNPTFYTLGVHDLT